MRILFSSVKLRALRGKIFFSDSPTTPCNSVVFILLIIFIMKIDIKKVSVFFITHSASSNRRFDAPLSSVLWRDKILGLRFTMVIKTSMVNAIGRTSAWVT